MIINLAKIRFGGNTGGGTPAKPEDSFQETYTANGSYDITPEAGHVFSGGHVEVDVHPTESLSLTITESGSYTSNDEFNGYSINVDVEGPKPEETLTQTITENGSHVFNPSEGHVFNSASITVDVPQGITPTGTINISDNGTYDVTDKATAVVAVGGKDYRYKTGTPDVIGLAAIGWTADDIGYYGANSPHYAWQNDNYKVSQENINLYSLDDPRPELYKDNPNVTFVPNKNMSTYFSNSQAFRSMKYIKGIPWYDTSSMTDMVYMFSYCSSLASIPSIDTSSVTNMGSMFYNCSSLASIPSIDTSKVTNMSSMFSDCKSLTSIPSIDTSKVTNMSQIFGGCSSLTSIPQLNTSNVTDMSNMFYNCSSLASIPQLDTSNVTNMGSLFAYCHSLQSIPQLNTSNVTNMNDMFRECFVLQSIPQLNTSNVTNMGWMFAYCSQLQSIPQLDTSKVTNMEWIFEGSSNILSVEGIDFSSLTSKPDYFFGWNIFYSLTRFIVNGSINFSWSSEAFDYTPSLNYESIKSILEAMNRTTNTDQKTMRFNNAIADREGEIAGLVASCATKGWTVTGLTIKEQSIINSITPDKEHIVASDIDGMYSPKLRFTVDASKEFTGGGCPAKHTTSSDVNCSFSYYNASTNEKVRDGKIVDSPCATPSGTVGVTEFNFYIINSENRPAPQSGEYALVGFTLKSTSEPYEFVDYYFKVYPDGE